MLQLQHQALQCLVSCRNRNLQFFMPGMFESVPSCIGSDILLVIIGTRILPFVIITLTVIIIIVIHIVAIITQM